MSTLSAKGLVKKFKDAVLVDHVDLEVSSGEVVGLLGPNGAGKTTSFNMIVGLITRTEGEITLDDLDIGAMPMHQRARHGIGYLPQEPSVFRKLTVEENILAVLEAAGKYTDEEREKKTQKLLEEFGVEHKRKSLGITLSGGERRRVEIARAVALEPAFILLDEPFAGIDPISVRDIQHVIEMLRERDIGVLITDHNVRETLGICNRAYILVAGKVVVGGTAQEIVQHDEVRKHYLGEHFTL
ncbi:MAG: LPS export ABC transporter ATP-binding protein [Pseudomonadota bacterium]|nr:LPS export ABC transporter ATP-binding protein [Pseudomonadota bacterium]